MQLYQNRTSAIAGFFCEYCQNFKNTYFAEKPQGDCFCISIQIVFKRSFDFLARFWSSAKKCFFVCPELATGGVL